MPDTAVGTCSGMPVKFCVLEYLNERGLVYISERLEVLTFIHLNFRVIPSL